MGAVLSLVSILASILVGLKNSSGQPLIPGAIGTAITAGESVVTSIVADIQQAKAAGGASASTVLTDSLAAIQALLVALQSTKVLSANTLAEIAALDTALQAAIAAELAAQKITDPSTLMPIPLAT